MTAIWWCEIARHRTPLCPRDSDYGRLAFHLSAITRSDDVFSCRLKSDSDGMLPCSLAPARPIAVRQLELRCEERRGEKRGCNFKMCFSFLPIRYFRTAVPFAAIIPIREEMRSPAIRGSRRRRQMIDWTVSPSMETPPTTDDTTRRHNTRCGRGRYMNFLVEFGLSLVRGQRLTQPYFYAATKTDSAK